MSTTRHILGLGDDPDADEDLTHDCQARLTAALTCLDKAVLAYFSYPTPAKRERLVKAAQSYAGACGDLAFVGERRTATPVERH